MGRRAWSGGLAGSEELEPEGGGRPGRGAAAAAAAAGDARFGWARRRFLEEEELRSHHILERLDAHIEELKRESEKTVRQFTALV